MKKILNKKILFILSSILFCLFFKNNSVFAVDPLSDSVLDTTGKYTSTYIKSVIDAGQSPLQACQKIIEEYNKDYPDVFHFSYLDLPQYYVCINSLPVDAYGIVYDHIYDFIFTEYKGREAGRFSEHKDYRSTCPSGVNSQKVYAMRFSDGGLTFFSSNIFEMSLVTHYANFGYNRNGSASFVSSNFDIYDSDGKEILFQPPVWRQVTTLAPVIQAEKEKGVLQAVLKEIVLLIPLILVVVVSLVGLRKALKMLFQLLRQS